MLGECLSSFLHHRRYQRLVGGVLLFLAILAIILNLPARSFRHPPPDLPLPDLGDEEEFQPVPIETEKEKKEESFRNPQHVVHKPIVNLVGQKVQYALKDYVAVPAALTMTERCPACFGMDLCEDIQSERIKVDLAHNLSLQRDIAIYRGIYQTSTQVWLKSFVHGEYLRKFEETLCLNRTGLKTCDVRASIEKSFATKGQTFRPDNLKRQYKVAHSGPEDLPLLVCITEAIVEQMQDAMFEPGDIAYGDMAMFYTSLTVYPEVNNLRFLTNTKSDIPFPALLGTCGQLVMMEDPGKPLQSQLTSPWQLRADMALQIFYIIESFRKDDDSVFLVYHGFEFNNLYATSDGRVLLVSAQELGFLDKEQGDEYEFEDGELCNEECLLNFAHDLNQEPSPEQEKICYRAPTLAANQMYAQLCRNVLSDLPEHKKTADRHPGQGLLHTLPKERESQLQLALKECVHETTYGSRMQAVEEIQEILSLYATEHAL